MFHHVTLATKAMQIASASSWVMICLLVVRLVAIIIDACLTLSPQGGKCFCQADGKTCSKGMSYIPHRCSIYPAFRAMDSADLGLKPMNCASQITFDDVSLIEQKMVMRLNTRLGHQSPPKDDVITPWLATATPKLLPGSNARIGIFTWFSCFFG